MISKKILNSLNIKLGDEIDFEIKDNEILIKKHDKADFREEFIKSFQDNGTRNDEKDWEEWHQQ